jgi:hypothetical protein
MNYQAIRAAVENPILTAFTNLSPSVPVFFDNITAAPLGSVTEYVLVNIIFGITNETTLNSSVDNAKGSIVIRVYSEKGKGPARSQTLITTAVGVLETLNDTAKTNSGVFFRTGDIDGPTFSTTEDPPLFEGRVDTSYFATVIS